MRVGLAILIAVVQLAGPWLCCCGPARVVAACAGTAIATHPTPPPASPLCPLCAQSEPKPAPTPEKKPTEPQRCPCGGAEFVALPVAKADDGPTAGVPLWEPPLVPVNPYRVISAVRLGDMELRELPHLTTADRLYAHHVLRC